MSAIPKLAQQVFPDLNGKELAKALAGLVAAVVGTQKLAGGSELTISGGLLAPVLKALEGDVS